MSGKFALIIGNTDYLDPGLAQLTAPGKDAQDFASVLKDQGFCAFQDVKVLLNQTEPIVREAIDEFFDQKKPEDLLVLYFSGHGVRDELGALYLAVTNTNRFRLRSTAVKSDFIREAMDQSRSKRQVLILDCCNSGAFAQGTKAATGVSIGTATAFEAGYGRVILTASDSTQFAWEGNQVIGETENSLFTHYLVAGLKGEADLDGDGCITVDELYDYAYEKVKLVTPGQTPSKFSTKQQGEIILRQNMRIEDIKPAPLPKALLESIENPFPDIRLGAVQQLTKLLDGKNLALARSAREALERIAEDDDSRTVSRTASQALESIRRAERAASQPTENEYLAPEKFAVEGRTQGSVQPLAQEKLAQNSLPYQNVVTEAMTGEETNLQSRIDLNQVNGSLHPLVTSRPRRGILPLGITGLMILALCLILSSGGYFLFQNISKEITPTPLSGLIPNLQATTAPTITKTVGSTDRPTKRPTETPRPSATPQSEAYVSIKTSHAILYKGPDMGFAPIQAMYERGERFTVVARNPSGLWLLCKAEDGNIGWLYTDWIEFSFNPTVIPTASYIPVLVSSATHKPGASGSSGSTGSGDPVIYQSTYVAVTFGP